MKFTLVASLGLLALVLPPATSWTQEDESEVAAVDAHPQPGPEDFEAFATLLTGTTLRGFFTMRNAPEGTLPRAESYQIKQVKQIGEDGRTWTFLASFNYGGRNWDLPLPIMVEWAARTPVITLDQFTIPGMGTFNARILFADGQYAGTWAHGQEVGGQMYGVVVPAANDIE